MQPIAPTQRLVVELEAQEWNMVLGGLVELQRSVGALINKITRQAAQQPGNGAEPAREAMRSADD
jgi:hypothetical protein